MANGSVAAAPRGKTEEKKVTSKMKSWMLTFVVAAAGVVVGVAVSHATSFPPATVIACYDKASNGVFTDLNFISIGSGSLPAGVSCSPSKHEMKILVTTN